MNNCDEPCAPDVAYLLLMHALCSPSQQTISDTISLVEKAAVQLNTTRGFNIPVARDASLPARLKTIQATLHKLAAELDARERDLERAQAHILELNFLHKLHGQDSKQAEPEGVSLPRLEDFSEADQAKIVKIQAQGRGYLARKSVAQQKADTGAPKTGGQDLPRLEDFSEADQAKIVKIQAQGRGYLARKSVAQQKTDNNNDDVATAVDVDERAGTAETAQYTDDFELEVFPDEDGIVGDVPLELATPPMTPMSDAMDDEVTGP